jgi:uncharacterized protein (DUF1697 family)
MVAAGYARGMAGTRHIALLRGVNVGGKNRLAMADLGAAFERAGCSGVRTYIQSGNVVFEAAKAAARKAAGAVGAILREEYGIDSPVIVRTAKEFAGVISSVPFRGAQADAGSLHVAFLAAKPGAARGAALVPDRSPGDVYRLVGREVYLHLPNGVAKTKITNAYLDRTLGTVSTMRNWRTVLRLGEMCGLG